jgi:hypothetical protein
MRSRSVLRAVPASALAAVLLTAGAGCGHSTMSGQPGVGGNGGSTVVAGGSGCPLFTADDAWNIDVSGAAVDAAQTAKVAALVGATLKLHPDFGPGFGIPFNVVPASQPPVPVTFDGYPDESDPGPYPFPDVSVARVEGTSDPHTCDGDCHLLAVQMGTCMLYEGYACHYANGWICSNGAVWDLKKKSYGQRPQGWTSVDAAGLPVYAGLARYEEVMAGEITHAIRFTLKCTTDSYIPPATHEAVPGGCDPTKGPPMGLRVRLKADYDGSALAPEAQVFVRAMKKYGMILADNGSNFYFQSEDSPSWSDGINDLKQVPASAFEAVVSP